MLSYLVIGTCIFLLIAVIYFSIKPISMGIEARRNIQNNVEEEIQADEKNSNNDFNLNFDKKVSISDEIVKLNKLRDEGLITLEEFEKAKNKLLD
jgi:hypothetical protein